MSNNNVAIVSLMAKFDEKSIDQAAQKLGKTTEQALSNIGQNKFGQEIVNQFNEAMDIVKKKLKGVNLSSYTGSILDSLISDKDIAEKTKDLQKFISNIFNLSKSLSGLGSNALNSMTTKQLDAIIAKQEKIAKKNEEIATKTKELESTAKNIAGQKRSVSTIKKSYGELDDDKSYKSLQKVLTTETEFDNVQQKSIKHLSEMLALYSEMEKVEPVKGTTEAIKHSANLLTVAKEIKKTTNEIDLFTGGKASKFVSENFDSIKKINQYGTLTAQQDYVKNGLKNFNAQKVKLEKDLTEYIGQSVQKNVQKIASNAEQVIDKTAQKIDKLQEKVDNLKGTSSSDKPIIDNIVDESQFKTLEELEDRLYSIYDKDSEGDASTKELKEFISLYQQYEKLISNATDGTKLDPELKEEYDFIIKKNDAMQKYADSIKEVKTNKDELLNVDSSSQTSAQLKEQETHIQNIEKAENDLADTQKTVSNTSITVDAEKAIESIKQVKENLDSIPNEKNIKISINNTDYSSVPLLSNEEGKTVTMFRGVKDAWSGLVNDKGIGFFTDKLKLAVDYADALAKDGKVIQANLALHNPLEIEGNGARWDQIKFNGVIQKTDDIIEKAKQLGYDGVIFKNILDGFTDTEADLSNVIAVFDTISIKNEKVIGAVKAGTGELTKIESTANSIADTVVDSQNKIQSELKETQAQAEETVQVIKEASSIPQESNISSGFDSDIEQQIKQQDKLQDEIRETIALTNEYGEVIDVYRGTHGLIGNGNVSNRYHGGTFWTSNRKLATQSYADGNKVTHANLYMRNPYLVHGGGADWDQLTLSIKQGEELEKHLENVYTSINDIFSKIQNTSGIEAGHLFEVFDGQLNFTDFENGIQKPIESLKDFQNIFESIDYDNSKIPQVQNYINQLYDLFTSYSRISQLSEKGVLNTNEVVEIAKALKYDGVVFNGIRDGSDDSSDIFVTFEEKQSKVIDMITAAQLRAEEEQQIANILVNTRENLYKTLKSLDSKQVDEFIDKSAFNFVTDGSYMENLGEVLGKADPTDSLDNIKNKIREYVNEVVNEFENAQKQIADSTDQRKDAFPESSTNTKPETEGMEQVEKMTKEAVQAKKDFATANESVQSSIDGSENPLKLEAELMEQIAKSAREAADAKKEFVEANKLVKESADRSNSENKKKDKYANIKKVSSDEFLDRYDEFLAVGNKVASQKGETILGNNVNISYDIENELVNVSAKIKDVDGTWRSFSAKLSSDLQVFPTGFRTITKGINKLDNELANFGKDEVKSDLTDIQIAKYQELENAIKNYEKISKRIASNSAYDGDEKSASDLLDTINEIMGKTNGGITVLSNEQLNKAQNKLDNIDQTISDIKQKTNISEFKNLEKLQSSAINKLNPYTNDTKYTIDFINKVNNLQKQIANFNLSNQSDVDRLKAIDAEIKNITKESNLLKNKLVKQKSNLAEIVSQMKIFKSQNTNMSRSQKAELDQIINYAETMQRSGEEVASEVENIKVRFAGLKAEVNETGKAGKNFFDQIGNRLSDMNSKFVAQFLSWQDWIRYIQQGISTIRDLDEAMTEVRKVSSATEAQYVSFQKTISSTAKEIASTNKELLNSSADFLRLGYSLDEASDLAKNATLFVNVGDGVDVNTATEDMITAMKAFDIQAKDSIKIVDSYNQIGNKFALSATDIGEAMKRSASALETGNNSFEESIALITAMNEIVQNSENTGNTLKVFSLRLRGAKAELEDMGEDTDGLCESSSKLREQLQALTGVDIMLNDNTFKSTTQIVKELGATWDKLSDSSQAAALELVAGKTRANNVAALLKNYKQIDNVLGSLEDAEGSALKENEAIVDSINGRIKTLSATAEEFWQKFINTDFVKNVVSLASDLLGLLTKIVDKFGTIPTLATAISAALSFKNVGRDKMYSLNF